MAQRQALRVLAGAEPRQPYHRWQGQELKDQAQRQPGRGGIAHVRQRAAPLRQRPGRVPAPEESRTWGRPRPSPPRRTSWPGSSIPCCATAKNTWMLAPNTTRASISTVRCARPNGGRPNSATNWCPCPMLSTMLRACPSTHQRPSPEMGCCRDRVSRESRLR